MIGYIPGFKQFVYNEKVPGSPSYSFANGMSRVERTFTAAWNDRIALQRFILGYPSHQTVGGQRYVTRYIPDAIPDFVDPNRGTNKWLYALSVVRMMGKGETGLYDKYGIAQYQEVEATFAYESRTYNICTDQDTLAAVPVGTGTATAIVPDESLLLRYVTAFQKPSAEFIQLPRGTMHWVDGLKSKGNNGTSVDFASARLIPSVEIALTWHEVPFQPAAATKLVGYVNGLPFKINNTTYDMGTLLLLGADIKPYRTAAGAFVQDITYRIKYMEPQPHRGHNYFLRQDPKVLKLVYTKMTESGLNDPEPITPDAYGPYDPTANRVATEKAGTAVGLYRYADFSYLFRYKTTSDTYITGN